MKKAVLTSRSEAERRLKEAAFARKRARESLLDVESSAAKEKAARSVVLDAKAKISQGNSIVGVPLAGGVDRGNGVDHSHSHEVSANLEDKDRRMVGLRAQSTGNGVSTGTQDKERDRGTASGMGHARPSVQNNVSVNEMERSGALAHYNGLEEKANKAAPFVLQGRNNSQ